MTETYSAPNSLIDMTVPMSRVRASNFNPRKRFDETQLQELADSIREHGLLEPIVVRILDGGNVFEGPLEIVAGERRYRACLMAGLETIPVRIHLGLDDEAALKLAIIENVQRVDLDPVEEAEGYRQLAKLGMKQREIAESVHRSQPAVANAMRILDLPEDVQERIRRGELTASHGIILASYKEYPKLASALGKMAAENAWTTKTVEKPFFSYSITEPLSRADLIQPIKDYDQKIDARACITSCPFGAYRHGEYGGYCLRPSHYQELMKETAEKRQAEVAAAVEKATAGGKKGIPKLGDLSYNSYVRLDEKWSIHPSGCTDECKCRTRAKGSNGELVTICVDRPCYEKLKTADERAKKKAVREQHQALKVQLAAAIDGLEEISSREMAILATSVLTGGSAPILREIFTRHAGIEPKDMPNMGYSERGTVMKRLVQLPVPKLLKMTIEGILLEELRNAYEGGGGGLHPRIDWYLGEQPAKPLLAVAELCPTAGLPCDPPTCVQDCSKAAEAQLEAVNA